MADDWLAKMGINPDTITAETDSSGAAQGGGTDEVVGARLLGEDGAQAAEGSRLPAEKMPMPLLLTQGAFGVRQALQEAVGTPSILINDGLRLAEVANDNVEYAQAA